MNNINRENLLMSRGEARDRLELGDSVFGNLVTNRHLHGLLLPRTRKPSYRFMRPYLELVRTELSEKDRPRVYEPLLLEMTESDSGRQAILEAEETFSDMFHKATSLAEDNAGERTVFIREKISELLHVSPMSPTYWDQNGNFPNSFVMKHRLYIPEADLAASLSWQRPAGFDGPEATTVPFLADDSA